MILLIAPGEISSYRVNVDGIGDATITSASVPAITGFTFGTVTPDNNTTPKSVILPVTAAAGTHARLEQIVITCVLSSGGTLPRPVTLRVSASM